MEYVEIFPAYSETATEREESLAPDDYQLPPGYRIVFILHEVEGHEHHEIAEILGCSIGTSKSQLHKARIKLRRLLRSDRKPARNQLSG